MTGVQTCALPILRERGYAGDNPWQDYANSVEGPNGEVLSGWHMRHAHLPARVAEEDSETAYMTNRAMDFMAEQGDRPWLLHLSYIKPHWPLMAPAPYHAMYSADDVPPPVRSNAERDNAHPVVRAFMEIECSRTYSDDAKRAVAVPVEPLAAMKTVWVLLTFALMMRFFPFGTARLGPCVSVPAPVTGFDAAALELLRRKKNRRLLRFHPERIAREELEPVVRWTTSVVQAKSVPAGTAVGYGGRWVAPRESTIALVPVMMMGLELLLNAVQADRKSTRLNSSHMSESRMPSSA